MSTLQISCSKSIQLAKNSLESPMEKGSNKTPWQVISYSGWIVSKDTPRSKKHFWTVHFHNNNNNSQWKRGLKSQSIYFYNINSSLASVGKSYQESYYSIQGSGLSKIKHYLSPPGAWIISSWTIKASQEGDSFQASVTLIFHKFMT